MPNLLLLLFFIPLIASFLLFCLNGLPRKEIKFLAVVLSLIPLALLLLGHFQWAGTEINYSWFPAASIRFHLGVDSLSLVFLYLTAIIVPITLLSVSSSTLSAPYAFYGLVLLLEALLIGFFTARDLALFTFFWEAMLLPLYFIINLWGGDGRKQASLKFLIYMIAGSVLMVAAVLALYFTTGAQTFNLDALSSTARYAPYALPLFLIFLTAFAVKTPLFPFHAWLPDAYCEASTPGSILLAALLSKAGIYGIARIGMELFPDQLKAVSPFLLALAIAGVFYGGLAAWMQSDFKRLVAYSSLSHVNFILAGLFIWNEWAHSGAILQAFNHGVTIAALFLAAGWLEKRIGSTALGPVSGFAQFAPHLCWLTLFFVLSSVALPGTNTFIGEILIFFGLFKQNPWVAGLLALTVILSVIYMLRWMQKVYFELPSFFHESWQDLKGKEWAVALPLIVLILWVGLFPAPILQPIEQAAKNIQEKAS
jgi:NADH-quinone oxidoreductase subunit M